MKLRLPAIIAFFFFFLTLIAIAGCINPLEEMRNAKIPKLTVTFDSNGGSPVPEDFEKGDPEGIRYVYKGERVIRPRNPEKANVGFINWYSDGALTKRFYFTTPVTANMTLYAKWSDSQQKVYTVTFDSRGGNPVESEIVGEGGTSSRPVPTRLGYKFDRWYSDVDLEVAWDTEDNTVTKNMTLYAKWIPITYTVVYYANGGSGSMASSTHTYDEPKNLNPNTFTRTGYIYEGWATFPEGAVVYSNGQEVINLASTQGAIVNLYARWDPISYFVYYDPYDGDGYMEPSEHTYDVESSLSLNEFTYPDNLDVRFSGWATSAGGPVVYGNGQNVKNLANTQGATVTLYAVWAYNYIVKFVDNYGASGSPPSEMRVQAGSPITIPGRGTLSLDGYTFSGWSGYAEGASFTPLEDTTLYAQWTYNYLDYYIDFEGQQSSTVYIGSIFRSSLPNVLRLYVADPSSYTSYEWYIDGNTIPSTNSSTTSVTINANAYSVDQHIICVVAKNGNYRYSKNIEFRVQ
jgi:uncharacterized repeat protein (TIGR02543 family)